MYVPLAQELRDAGLESVTDDEDVTVVHGHPMTTTHAVSGGRDGRGPLAPEAVTKSSSGGSIFSKLAAAVAGGVDDDYPRKRESQPSCAHVHPAFLWHCCCDRYCV